MSDIEDILDINQLIFTGDFDDQATNLLSAVRLTRSEVEDLQRLFDDLYHVLNQAFEGCEVHPFGSIVTGLGMKTSDVDCYISLPYWVKQDCGLIMRVKYLLSKQHSLFCDLFAIPKAKVPIVKFYHLPTHRHCDINFTSPSGVKNSCLLAYMLHLDKRLIPLTVLIKYWCKTHNLTGTNLAPNYAMIMLVIFYLQKLEILPSVWELQNHMKSNLVDNWNVVFNDNYHYTTSNKDSLYNLFGGFFTFYCTFNFDENVISPYLGSEVKRSDFVDLRTTRDEFSLYKYNLTMKNCEPLKINTKMCVQDPFEHSRNCAGAVHPTLFTKFKSLCEKAAKHFSENVSSELLKLILLKDPSIEPVNKKKRKNTKINKKTKKVFAIKQKAFNNKQYRSVLSEYIYHKR